MRVYYCPTHGKVTEGDFLCALNGESWYQSSLTCEHCSAWFYRRIKFKAKKAGES